MATATLEMNNPFSKIGLKRRPTYNEIINLIDENKTITGNLPDRTATFYKASPEGSFFDGTDALELLKEQQSRILQRQMQDLLLRQNIRANGGTFNIERTRQSTSSSDTSSSTELQQDRGNLSIGLQADLQRREAQLRDRQQQTGEAHRQEISRQSQLPTLQGFLSGITSPIRASRPVPQIDLTRDDTQEAEEEFFPEEMTAREGEPLMQTISYSNDIDDWSVEELKFQLFIRGRKLNFTQRDAGNLRMDARRAGVSPELYYYRLLAERMIEGGTWQRRIEEQLLQSRIKQYNDRNRARASSG